MKHPLGGGVMDHFDLVDLVNTSHRKGCLWKKARCENWQTEGWRRHVLARLVRHGVNRAICIKLMHWNPRKDDLRPRHPLQPSILESWGKHGHHGR